MKKCHYMSGTCTEDNSPQVVLIWDHHRKEIIVEKVKYLLSLDVPSGSKRKRNSDINVVTSASDVATDKNGNKQPKRQHRSSKQFLNVLSRTLKQRQPLESSWKAPPCNVPAYSSISNAETGTSSEAARVTDNEADNTTPSVTEPQPCIPGFKSLPDFRRMVSQEAASADQVPSKDPPCSESLFITPRKRPKPVISAQRATDHNS